jgi:lipopolysaccharide export system protein LptA
VRITPEKLDYFGRVQLFRGDGEINADHLAGYRNRNLLQADGNVVSLNSAGTRSLRVEAASLEITESAKVQSARYTGRVRAEKRDPGGAMILETAELDVRLSPAGEVASLEARGGVLVTQGPRAGSGVEAVYSAAEQTTVLRGSDAVDAVVRAPEGETRGYQIRTNQEGRAVSASPSRVKGGVQVSTDKVKK